MASQFEQRMQEAVRNGEIPGAVLVASDKEGKILYIMLLCLKPMPNKITRQISLREGLWISFSQRPLQSSSNGA